MNEETVPTYLLTSIDEAMDMVKEQMVNPGVYNDNTQWALDKISAYAALFVSEGAFFRLRGESKKASFCQYHADALKIIIDSLKYKIKVGKPN